MSRRDLTFSRTMRRRNMGWCAGGPTDHRRLAARRAAEAQTRSADLIRGERIVDRVDRRIPSVSEKAVMRPARHVFSDRRKVIQGSARESSPTDLFEVGLRMTRRSG